MKIKLLNKQGFTLLELLVTVLIIAVLSGIAIPNYMRTVERTRIATHIPFLLDTQKGIVLYYASSGYPTTFKKLPVSISNAFQSMDPVAVGQPIRAVKKDALCEMIFTPATDILEYKCKKNSSESSFGSVGWKFEFTFKNVATGLITDGKYFIVTSTDASRLKELRAVATAQGWKEVSTNKFDIN